MVASFNEQFDSHGAWRREFALRLKLLAEWMRDHDLLDAAVQERMLRLESQMRSDKVMVAFVAEFSRGKSELINAIFFAAYGKRIMPASAGRTTMCPTELGWDADITPCLRLLPIETRLENIALMEENLARYDLAIYLRRPAYGMNYTVGKAQMERLVADRSRQLGDAFDLGRFHDEFLSKGSIPIALIRWEMTGLDDEVRKLGLRDD